MKMGQSVPKRRDINFRRRGFTKKKVYNISNTILQGADDGIRYLNSQSFWASSIERIEIKYIIFRGLLLSTQHDNYIYIYIYIYIYKYIYICVCVCIVIKLYLLYLV